MEFLLVVPKNPAKPGIPPVDVDILNDPGSLTYPGKDVKFINKNSILIWTYKRDTKVPNNQLVINENGVYVTKGTAILDGQGIVNSEIAFMQLRKQKENVQGDYLLLGINSDGTGEIFTTTMTFCPLFVHYDEGYTVLSTDLGLLNKSLINRKGNQITDFFDVDYIYESVENEWGTREFPEKTMFFDITRVLTTTKYQFNEFRLASKSIQYDLFRKDLEEIYLLDKKDFYEYCFDIIEKSIREVFKEMSNCEIELLMSGGLDSRLSSVLVSHIASEYNISLRGTLFGPEDHPDVIIGKKVADLLNIPSKNKTGDGKIWKPSSTIDYYNGMLVSWGDWSSNNWRTSNIFQERLVIFKPG